MIPFDFLDEVGNLVDNDDVIDGVNDATDVPEVTDDVDSPETETPEDPENETQENPETKTEQDSGTDSTDVPVTEAGQNVHKTEAEDPDLIVNPYSRMKEKYNPHFGGGKGSCNICRDDGFSCKGGYDGEHRIGAKCKNCGHLYEQHQW